MANKYFLILFLSLICFKENGKAYSPTPFFRPYDTDFYIRERNQSYFCDAGCLLEYGATSHGKDDNDCKRDAFSLYDCSEDLLAALSQETECSDSQEIILKQFSSTCQLTLDDNRGKLDIRGKVRREQALFWSEYKRKLDTLPGQLFLSFHFPVHHFRVTQSVQTRKEEVPLTTCADIVAEKMVSQVDQLLATQGNGLSINNWNCVGIGDITFMMGWREQFRRTGRFLKSAAVQVKTGLSAPTGKVKNENLPLSFPLGNNGAWSIPFCVGLDLFYRYGLGCGGELDVLGSFNATKNLRLATNQAQTDYLVLSKGKATLVQGTSWRFKLHAFIQDIERTGLGFFVGYQFEKHDGDRIYPKSDSYSFDVVNKLKSLQEWTCHTLTFQMEYTPKKGAEEKFSASPYFSLFCKIPVVGRQVYDIDSYGGRISFSF